MPQRWIAVATTRGALVAHALGAPISTRARRRSRSERRDRGRARSACHRRGHALDGRLRRGRAHRHGAAPEDADAVRAAGHRRAGRVRRLRARSGMPAATAVASLLDAHHYTEDSGSCAAARRPTTAPEQPSGWSAQDPHACAQLSRRSAATPAWPRAATRTCWRARWASILRHGAAHARRAVGRRSARADRRAADGGRVVAGDMGLLPR